MSSILDTERRAARRSLGLPVRQTARAVIAQPLIWLLVALLVLAYFTSEYFFSPANLDTLMRDVAVFGFLAMGMTLVLLTGRIDLSVAAVMIFSVIGAIQLMSLIGAQFDIRMIARGGTYVGPALPLIGLTLLLGALAGLVNGVGVAYGRVAPFVMTLVSLSALRGLSYTLTNGHAFYVRSDAYQWLGEAHLLGIPLGTVAYFVLFLTLAWLLHMHVIGKRIYAIGGDEKTARFAGINVRGWIVLVYVASGLCAACAGVLFTSRLMSVDAPLANGYELNAIAIAVLGGTSLAGGYGSPFRTLCGGLIFAIGLSLLNMWGVGAWYQNLIVGVVLIVAVALVQWLRRGAR
ncbi:ABC transporter permease [Caballeronia sp. dw_19]|jgi:ribose transport system permease protein|uniref:ABC transporter permease n=1 Tax=Caballeronia sp. dw_19 TaxID=2719791 RepID=UPI001BD67D60|nr:ABC transporter permease [Caballeronia sp. dw_19]